MACRRPQKNWGRGSKGIFFPDFFLSAADQRWPHFVWARGRYVAGLEALQASILW